MDKSCVNRYGGHPHIHAHTAQEGNGRFCLSALRKTRTFVQVPHGPTAPLIPDGNAHALPMRVCARATPHSFQSAQTAMFMCVCVRMVTVQSGVSKTTAWRPQEYTTECFVFWGGEASLR